MGTVLVMIEGYHPLSSIVSASGPVQGIDNALDTVLENVNELEKRRAPEPM